MNVPYRDCGHGSTLPTIEVTRHTSASRLAIVSLDEEVLRYEYGVPVTGLVAVLSRPDAPTH